MKQMEKEKLPKSANLSTQTIVMTGMLTAVISVLSIIAIPMPTGVPVTLQTFAVALCGYVAGSKRGTAATALYILLGAIGVPVFSGMRGGLGVLTGYAGGFIWGFLLLTIGCGIGLTYGARFKHSAFFAISSGILGLFFCHLLGVLQFMFLTKTGFFAAAVQVSVPYLIKDMISILGAWCVAAAVRKGLRAGYFFQE